MTDTFTLVGVLYYDPETDELLIPQEVNDAK